jgi:hypothetical protein
MTRGKRLECPHITIVRATEPKFKTCDEVWQVVGSILARILAQTISVENRSRKVKPTANDVPKPARNEFPELRLVP